MAGITPRDALLDAVLPIPVDRSDFWPRFDAAAPWSLRLGLAVAVQVLRVGWPVGRLRALHRLPDDLRDRCVVRASGWPLIGDLVLIARVVAALAVFEDPAQEARFR